MQHLLVYSGTAAIGATEADLPAVPDPAVTRQNGHYILNQNVKLYMALTLGTGLARARLNAPQFRRTFLPYLWPLNLAAAMPSDPSFVDYRDTPLTILMNEEIEVDTTNTDVGAQTHTVGLFVGDTLQPPPSGGDIYSLRCTAAITAVAGAWTAGAMTFGQTLPAGQYAVVGMEVQSSTILFARLILQGQAYRPGVVGVTAIGNRPPFQGDKAPLGVLGTFVNTALPQLDLFCTAADAAQVVHLDLVKVA